VCVHFLRIPKRFQLARAASAPLKMEARSKAQCNPDLVEDGPSKLEQILKDRHNPDLGADEEVGRLTALLDGIADAEVRLDRLEAAKCQTCRRNPGVYMKPHKHQGRCTCSTCKKTKGCMKLFEHAGECKNTNSVIRPRCKKTLGCCRKHGHEAACNTNLGTPGTKCEKVIGCVRWDGHCGPHNDEIAERTSRAWKQSARKIPASA
jgi:hypothetical protein